MSLTQRIGLSHETLPGANTPKPVLDAHPMWRFNNWHLPERGQYNPHDTERHQLYHDIADAAQPILIEDPETGRQFGTRLFSPPVSSPVRGVIIENSPFMAHHGNPAYRQDLAAISAESGHAVLSMEFMGHGRSSRIGSAMTGHLAQGDFRWFAQQAWRALDATPQTAELLRRTQDTDDFALSLGGVSLGGSSALAMLAHDTHSTVEGTDTPRRIDSLVVIDPTRTVYQNPLKLLARYGILGIQGATAYVAAAKQRGDDRAAFDMTYPTDPAVYWLTLRRSAAAGTGSDDLRRGLEVHPETRAFAFHAGSSEINRHAGRLAFNAVGNEFGDRFTSLIGPGDTHALTNASSQRVGRLFARGLEQTGVPVTPVR